MLQVTIPMRILFRVIYLHNVYINDTQAIYIKKNYICILITYITTIFI